jgi:hypothetical protein
MQHHFHSVSTDKNKGTANHSYETEPRLLVMKKNPKKLMRDLLYLSFYYEEQIAAI